MKRLLFTALLAMSGTVLADDLADAERLLAAQSYDKALPIYQRLAEAGNPAAQMRLGEMYWFGDGTASDLGKARTWFEKSAAAGNKDAAISLASLKRRDTHGAEIAYWTRTYDGADLVSGKFACKTPTLPPVSVTRSEIKSVSAAAEEYSACYNGFVDNVQAAMPPGKRIPAETLDMMTPAEAKQAQAHLAEVYAKVSADARSEATAFAARETMWRAETEKYVADESVRDEKRKELIKRSQDLARDSSMASYRDANVQKFTSKR